MNRNPEYKSIYSWVALLLILAINTPSVVKLVHGLTEHHHDLCVSTINEHFHEQEWDCEFQKFKLGSQLAVLFDSPEIDIAQFNYTLQTSIDQSFNKPDLGLYLQRGPPVY